MTENIDKVEAITEDEVLNDNTILESSDKSLQAPTSEEDNNDSSMFYIDTTAFSNGPMLISQSKYLNENVGRIQSNFLRNIFIKYAIAAKSPYKYLSEVAMLVYDTIAIPGYSISDPAIMNPAISNIKMRNISDTTINDIINIVAINSKKINDIADAHFSSIVDDIDKLYNESSDIPTRHQMFQTAFEIKNLIAVIQFFKPIAKLPEVTNDDMTFIFRVLCKCWAYIRFLDTYSSYDSNSVELLELIHIIFNN